MSNKILERIELYSREYPERMAIKFMGNSITYKRLENEVDRLSRIIGKYKSRRSEPILIYMDRGMEFVIAILGTQKSGCYYIPIECPFPMERITTILNDLKCKIVITIEKYKHIFEDNIKVLCMDEEESVFEQSDNHCDISNNDLAYIIYTSGTTGTPKGVKIMYKNLLNLVDSFYDIIYKDISGILNIGVIASFSFDASIKQIFCALFYGHTLVIAEQETKFFGKRIEYFLKQNDIDIIDVTPTILKILNLQKMNVISKDIIILVGGENLKWETLYDAKNILINAKFINVYGPTECCVDSSYYIIDNEQLKKNKGTVPIGSPLKNTILQIVDENGENILEEGVGELCIVGAQVGAGYVGLNSTQFLIQKNGQNKYFTGDIAKYKDGNIYILGRNDSQIKINGYRVDVNEIEVMAKRFGIKEVIIGVNKRNNNDILTMYYCDKMDINEKEIVEYLKKYLPTYMIPKRYIRLESMPINKNGKIDINLL